MKGPRAPKVGAEYANKAPCKMPCHKVGPMARGGARENITGGGVTRSALKAGSFKPSKGK